MITSLLKKIFGTQNERELKAIAPIITRINELEASITILSDDALRAKTDEFKSRFQSGETLDELLPEAFAVVREAGRRVLNMRHFDAQLIGGIVLHRGQIAEMKTGEGKTLVATLPVYLNALSGKGVHVVTVNDYLARRDSEWMGRLYTFLGLTVGVIIHGRTDAERQQAYRSDIVYGTNNEFGFDYLRDNMKFDLAHYVQRELNFCIVDEVDSILIDEARTPLIISGQAEESAELYNIVDGIIPFLKKESHYTIDEKARSVMLTEEGVTEVERRLNIQNLYDPQNINFLHHVNQGLRAHALYHLDTDYVVKDGKVVIVDEFTGRLMPGRRWGDGLHQAVEAKEGVAVENENQTLATITFQNFFRMYSKLAGMTGTADTEAAEFAKIYNLDVRVIPTNREMIRIDHADIIYKTVEGKFRAIVEEVKKRHETGQPVLVGTISIEKSERLSKMLGRFGIPHHVLNAKHHEREAEIVAQAGRKGAVTISTNMAGRGTDILLGGNPEFLARSKAGTEASEEDLQRLREEFRIACDAEKKDVLAAGGLLIIGTERHESRRIDNQLRGRAGRQGDPGSSQFYLSLEDDLLRIFGGERISGIMERMGMREDEEIQHPLLSRAIANAQRKVEAHNFQIRKNLLEFDDVMNQQRATVYSRRREILAGENNRELVLDMIDQCVTEIVEENIPVSGNDPFDPASIEEPIRQRFNLPFSFGELPAGIKGQEAIGQILFERVVKYYEEREAQNDPEIMNKIARILMLQTLDQLWKDHLLQMDHLKEGIGLRGYAQKDPLLEYKKEGFLMFRNMMASFTIDVVEKLFRVQVTSSESVARAERIAKRMPAVEVHPSAGAFASEEQARPRAKSATQPLPLEFSGVGRNDPCPCGSGKKYKKCHGA